MGHLLFFCGLLVLTAGEVEQERLVGAGAGLDTVRRWSYDTFNEDIAPRNWGKNYEECGGEQQSPIDINFENLDFVDTTPFTFHNYDTSLQGLSIQNNGHSVVVSIPDPVEADIRVSGGNLPGDYILQQFHFHWADKNDNGSEHTVESKHYPLEIHLVHFKVGLDPNTLLDDPEGIDPEGIAILGVFYEVDSQSFLPQNSPVLQNIAYSPHLIKETHDTFEMSDSFKLMDLLPENTARFFRYEGSLTTPPCTENVLWSIFRDTVKISPRVMTGFRKVMIEEGTWVKQNNRPVQPDGGRKVTYYNRHGTSENEITSSLNEGSNPH